MIELFKQLEPRIVQRFKLWTLESDILIQIIDHGKSLNFWGNSISSSIKLMKMMKMPTLVWVWIRNNVCKVFKHHST